MIRILCGPEGSGKTCVMTWFACEHVRLGGELYTFPGYKVFDKDGETEISKEISIEEFLARIEEMNNVLLAIDELQNFVDSYHYQSVFATILTAVEAQRRKRNLGVIGTVQQFEWLPPRIRYLTHIVGEVWDLHWKYPALERGSRIAVTWFDMKGFYTGHPGKQMRPKIFRGKLVWNRFNTYAMVDIWERFTKVKVKGKEIMLDASNPEASYENFQLDEGVIAKYAPSYQPSQLSGIIASTIAKLRERGVEQISQKSFYHMIQEMGVTVPSTTLGQYLPQDIKRKRSGDARILVLV